jgi:pimeloyl-ACP methyl ester carboxylesterase
MVIRGRIGSCPGEEPLKRLLAVLVAAALAVSLAAFDGASASPTVPSIASYTPTLAWHPCGTDQCADFVVPLDHANPDGAKITLAVRRRTHTATPYRGVMLANPGGPGASGTGLVALADYVPSGVGHQYDWIGFDPRGVGASVPALRCDSHFFGVNRPSYVPTTKRLMRFWKTKTRRYAASCGASSARALLPHMTTQDSVDDMELLRQALGTSTISFYGFSYGSYLGQVYATQFPSHVGRFVLDGVVDPATYWYRANLRQEIGFDRSLNVFFRWIARHPRAYHLGRHWRDIRHGYNRLLKKLDRHPAYHRKLGPDELTDSILNAAYYVYSWDFFASAYSDLVRHGRGKALFTAYRDANMGDDNGYAVYVGVQCSDVLRPSWSTQVNDAWRIHRKRPFIAWDNTWFNAPCFGWQAPSHQRLRVSGAGLGAKILLINETKDAATPFTGALRARAAFPSASLIAGVGGTTHAGSLSGVSCVDNAISAYLATGKVPTRLSGSRADLNCPKVPPPPATGSGRVAGQGGLPPSVRALLTGAQLIGRS